MANSSKAKYLCKMHLVAGVMPFDTLKKSDVFYTLTGKSAETDTSEGVREDERRCPTFGRSTCTSVNVFLFSAQTKIRIHGSRKRGVVIQSDLVASNGMIHIINKLMDSVAATVEGDGEVDEE